MSGVDDASGRNYRRLVFVYVSVSVDHDEEEEDMGPLAAVVAMHDAG